MNKSSWQIYGFIYLSCIVGFILTIWPLPKWAEMFRPDWLSLIAIFWTLSLPMYFNLGHAWILGLMLDAIYGSALGMHALGLTIIIYATAKFQRQLRVLPIWQLSLIIMLLLFIYQIILLMIQSMLGQTMQTIWFWLPVISSMVFWPWLYLILKDYQRRFHME